VERKGFSIRERGEGFLYEKNVRIMGRNTYHDAEREVGCVEGGEKCGSSEVGVLSFIFKRSAHAS
jgi:hypothetical protein